MIFGIGTDIAKISRFEKYAEKIAQRCLSQQEREEISKRKENIISAVAKRFSAKESLAKALGCGFVKGIYLKQIEIIHDNMGKPYINLCGAAADYLKEKTNSSETAIFLSISDDGEYVQSFVIIEKIQLPNQKK